MKPHRTKTPRDNGAGRGVLILMLPLVMALSPLIAGGAQNVAGLGSKAPSSSADALMLVREWDPKIGSLIGWLPIHSAEIQLELLPKQPAPHFALDEVVHLIWVKRPPLDSPAVQLEVSPSPRTFEGESWLPVKRTANLVRIGKSLYLIRRLTLNGSARQRPGKKLDATRDVASNEPAH